MRFYGTLLGPVIMNGWPRNSFYETYIRVVWFSNILENSDPKPSLTKILSVSSSQKEKRNDTVKTGKSDVIHSIESLNCQCRWLFDKTYFGVEAIWLHSTIEKISKWKMRWRHQTFPVRKEIHDETKLTAYSQHIETLGKILWIPIFILENKRLAATTTLQIQWQSIIYSNLR